MSNLVCGFDLGGTKLLGMVVDPGAAEPIWVDRVPTPSGTDAIIEAIADLSQTLRGHAGQVTSGQGPVDIRAFGLGAPGLVDRSGTFRYGPNLAGVVNVNLRDRLTERLGAPVEVDNDATCAGWGEHQRGAARGANHSLTITLGTGIGAGITVKGELL